jgi:site-specific recombinase XerD
MSLQLLSHNEWLSKFNLHLSNVGYACGTRKYYIPRAGEFLVFLKRQRIGLSSVTPTDVDRYLQYAMRRFRDRYGGGPVDVRWWRSAYGTPVDLFLRFAHGHWPPDRRPATAAERFRRQLREDYVRWMFEVRGLSAQTVSDRYKELRRFMAWLGERADRAGIAALAVPDIDSYLKHRATSQGRSSMKTVVIWMRSLLRWLYTADLIDRDLSITVVAPSGYALEGIPSALRQEDVEKVLIAARQDHTAQGIRNYAILMLLARYGVRAGEIAALRLDDIDWRKEVIRVVHAKTGATSYLPLLPDVGDAILRYLQESRPAVFHREIFIRQPAPHRPFKKGASLYSLVRERLDAAGIMTPGRRGPHAFRHTRAVSLLRARVPLKEIGDVLGHRSTDSTMSYLKLAVDDLRAIALDVPMEVRA